jgi:hypothetical protein
VLQPGSLRWRAGECENPIPGGYPPSVDLRLAQDLERNDSLRGVVLHEFRCYVVLPLPVSGARAISFGTSAKLIAPVIGCLPFAPPPGYPGPLAVKALPTSACTLTRRSRRVTDIPHGRSNALPGVASATPA